MEVAIKILNDQIYIDKDFIRRFGRESIQKYNYEIITIDDKYKECVGKDFVIDENTNKIVFSESKFNERVKKENEEIILHQLIKRLEELTKDFVRVDLGAILEDLEDRKTEYREVLDEVRRIQGKGPVKYNIIKEEKN